VGDVRPRRFAAPGLNGRGSSSSASPPLKRLACRCYFQVSSPEHKLRMIRAAPTRPVAHAAQAMARRSKKTPRRLPLAARRTAPRRTLARPRLHHAATRDAECETCSPSVPLVPAVPVWLATTITPWYPPWYRMHRPICPIRHRGDGGDGGDAQRKDLRVPYAVQIRAPRFSRPLTCAVDCLRRGSKTAPARRPSRLSSALQRARARSTARPEACPRRDGSHR
jgi:hypothetical protein